VPSETKKILTNLGRVQNFSFDRPTFRAPRVDITTYGGARYILENQDKYKVIRAEGLSFLLGSGDGRFKLSGDTTLQARQRKSLDEQLFKNDWNMRIKAFYARMTDDLLKEKSYKLAGTNFVDIVRDVGNIAPVHFVSSKPPPLCVYIMFELVPWRSNC
jgi:prostaglandin-endoperoxide synthase 1/linoleate 10R-lipoxygenase